MNVHHWHLGTSHNRRIHVTNSCCYESNSHTACLFCYHLQTNQTRRLRQGCPSCTPWQYSTLNNRLADTVIAPSWNQPYDLAKNLAPVPTLPQSMWPTSKCVHCINIYSTLSWIRCCYSPCAGKIPKSLLIYCDSMHQWQRTPNLIIASAVLLFFLVRGPRFKWNSCFHTLNRYLFSDSGFVYFLNTTSPLTQFNHDILSHVKQLLVKNKIMLW